MKIRKIINLIKRLRQKFLSARKPRYVLANGMQPDFFLLELKKLKVRYVVLRWFEDLPSVAHGEDIDILFDDEDIPKIEKLVNYKIPNSNDTICDLYTVEGAPGFDYKSIPYYPVQLARQILDRAVMHHSGALVPCPEDHFLSLAYHVVYHKGDRSGVSRDSPQIISPEFSDHDYFFWLMKLAKEAALSIDEISLVTINSYLKMRGLAPPSDTLSKLSRGNSFCEHLLEEAWAAHISLPGLCTFVVRERAEGFINEIKDIIERHGFDILKVVNLEITQRKIAQRKIRGGNWGRGPYAFSGGPPCSIIVAFDIFQIPPTNTCRKNHPYLENRRSLNVKSLVRDHINEVYLENENTNVLHSSDNSLQAQEYVGLIDSACLQEVQKEAMAILSDVKRSSFEIVKSLTRNSKRAIVTLVKGGNGDLLVVKKFRRSKQRYFLREISALRNLKEHDVFNVIPPIVFCNVDDLEYAIPYFNDSLQGMMQKASLGYTIPLSVVRKAFASAKKFYEAGYEFCDFGPHNILLDEVQGMKFIDFEFVFKTDRQKTIPFVESQWVKGPDPSVSDDVPYIQGMEKGQAYVYVCPWHLGCGVPVSVILNGTSLGEGSSKLKIRTLFNVVKYKIRSFPKNLRSILPRVYRNFIKSV